MESAWKARSWDVREPCSTSFICVFLFFFAFFHAVVVFSAKGSPQNMSFVFDIKLLMANCELPWCTMLILFISWRSIYCYLFSTVVLAFRFFPKVRPQYLEDTHMTKKQQLMLVWREPLASLLVSGFDCCTIFDRGHFFKIAEVVDLLRMCSAVTLCRCMLL